MATLKKNFGRKQQWRNEAIAYLVESLADLGQRACQDAIDAADYTNRKYNLRDSYGSAVYVDGKIVHSSKRYAHRKSSKGPYIDKGYDGDGVTEITGREALDRYWDNHERLPNARNTVELVVVAATFYAGILESAGYEVLSAAVDTIEDEMEEYKSFRPKLRAHADHFDL